ncbi:ExeM/NucH family extracellular endonuclease [Deinococcus aerophilus]|uniref:ExeM/NucH family extracellular endonuclease n=1 Tax=Deinococcus aerophilus TaxID=522488 RepID=A0ABQ2GR62_9DEIO|nr:ExeM/NucH family extracellular endonuclease [Deinococcus aerophilus]GGM08860.1 hypothetical protein GCM10010841_16540 [Deinococcus aerophilus]
MKKRTLLSLALLLSACGQSPSTAPHQATKSTAQFRILSLPAEVREVVVDVTGTGADNASEVRSVTATLSGGTASVSLPDLIKGRYRVVARAYDGMDADKVVLYKGTLSVDFQSEAVSDLRVNRVTSAIMVTATGVTGKSNVLVAKVGDLEARLLANGNTATGVLQGVPTGRGIQVIVNGTSTAGALVQQGVATVRLSENDQTVTLPLSDVNNEVAPNAPALSGEASVKNNQPYTLTVGASQNPNGPETLQSVDVDWGDGSAPTTLTLNGKSAEVRPTHTYTAPGNRTVSVTVTNSAGLKNASSLNLNVLDTVTGNVTVDFGAEVTPVQLTAQDVPTSAERVVATFTAPTSFQGNRLGAQDLKVSYTLELIPRGGGVWSGGLSLPVGITHQTALTAYVNGQPVAGAQGSVTPTVGHPAVTLPFGGNGPVACPAGATITPISTVQGSGSASPLVNQTVTVRGIVTLDAQSGLGGFFVQDLTPDADPQTSEGLFVYTASAPQPVKAGEVVEVSGTVKEFFASTQLDTVTTVTSCGEMTLPAATTVSYPLASPDALEAVEGMLVRVTTPMTVTNTFTLGRYGELGLSSGGRLFNPTNGQGGTLEEARKRTLVLDDVNSKQNPPTIPYLTSGDPATATRRAGDTVTDLQGVMHYANNTFKLEPTVAPMFTVSNPRTEGPKAVGGTLKVAGANVLNYFTTLGSAGRGASNATEFARQKAKIVAELRALDADVITLMEIENNGETALDDLVAALNAAAGRTEYASVKTGTVGTDAIRVAMIYRPDRVSTVGAPRTDTDPVYSRPPVAQTFRDITGKGVFTVVANHFKSKGCGSATGANVDSGQGCWNALRVDQAKALLAFADKLKVTDPDVLLMGDLNAYGEEDPIKALENGGFASLNKRIPADDRYSFQFDGLFGYLDHALASQSLDGQVTGITEWHINADEPVVLDYNIEYKNNPGCTGSSCTSPDLYAPTPYRSSDHDPVLVGLSLTADADPTVPLTVTAGGESTATTGQPYTLNISTGGAPETLNVAWGDGLTDTLSTTATSATHTYAGTGPFTITVTAGRGSEMATATQAVTVQAAPDPGVGRLVISQVYGGGGNSGATLKNDFVELFNAGKVAVSTAGKSLQYASAAGTFKDASADATANASNTTSFALPSVTIQPGAYYLVQLAKGTGGTQDLPTPDATGAVAMSGTNGKVALVGNLEAITGKTDADVLDFVGYGSASEFEGTAATPVLSNTTAALRAGNGCTDTDQNGSDFTVTAPAPRNSAAPTHTCP